MNKRQMIQLLRENGFRFEPDILGMGRGEWVHRPETEEPDSAMAGRVASASEHSVREAVSEVVIGLGLTSYINTDFDPPFVEVDLLLADLRLAAKHDLEAQRLSDARARLPR